jgi:hypothetical protein
MLLGLKLRRLSEVNSLMLIRCKFMKVVKFVHAKVSALNWVDFYEYNQDDFNEGHSVDFNKGR